MNYDLEPHPAGARHRKVLGLALRRQANDKPEMLIKTKDLPPHQKDPVLYEDNGSMHYSFLSGASAR
ncbi:hypothetical protein BACI349Y_10069 [Bacillus sp. 349Y]|nr:hypothetical protein BACI349Y_10069 [Bacillus sp. 349Y]